MVSQSCRARLRLRPIQSRDPVSRRPWRGAGRYRGSNVVSEGCRPRRRRRLLLGNQYANGKGVPQDYSEAMIWFQRAAEQGHSVAKLYLGVMYAEGRGVPQDYVRAHMWFSLSAAQGDQRAVKTLEMAERRMTPAQIN